MSRTGPLGARSVRVLSLASHQIRSQDPKAKGSLIRKAADVVKKSSRVLRAPLLSPPVKPSSNKRSLAGNRASAPKSYKAQRTLSRTQEVALEVDNLAKANRLTTLERRSVSRAIETQYASYYRRFASFCRENSLDPPPSPLTDDHLAEYMDIMFAEGKGMNEGEKTLASVEYHHSSLKGKMLRSRKALKGWRKEMPPASRLPLPKVIAYGMSMAVLAKQKKGMALKLIADFDTYMRPGESQDLKVSSLVAPVKKAGPQYRWFSVVVRPFDDLRPDKVGVFDNSIPFNSKGREWIGEMMQAHVKKLKKKKSDLIYDFTAEEYRKEFQKAGQMMGLEGLHPYQLRHGGAAEDLNSKARDYPSVKARGRWQTDASVRRYTKVGKVQQLLNQLSKRHVEFCLWSVRNLEKVFRDQVLPRSPLN